MSLNSYFLSVFAKKSRFTTDVKSFLRRFQILSIIYINISLIFIICGYEVAAWLFLHPEGGHILTTVFVPGFVTSFLLLRLGKHDLSAVAVLCYMHCVNFSAGRFTGQPMVALYALMLFPTFGFFLAPNSLTRNLNTIICGFQCIHHVRRIQEKFQVTLNDDQSLQIAVLNIAAFVCLGVLSSTCLIQKAVENNLWQMAQSSYEKSERLTREVVQAAEAKDAFVSSLSHEIRNPLNSMNGSIEYLLGVVKDASQLEVLKNAKLGSVILLNLVNNVLDAAKLKSDKMEVVSTETSFVDIIKKVLTINAETLKRNKICTQAFVDRSLPQVLWIDPSRFLQIIMNLISNALKFTPPEGEIHIHVAWCPANLTHEELLTPIEDDIWEVTQRSSRDLQTSMTSLGVNMDMISSSELNNTEEFTSKEAKSRNTNLKSIKIFQNHALKDVYDAEQPFRAEPWTIHRVGVDNTDNEELKKKGFLKVQVTDTGCGIPADSVPKMFKMFAQAHSSAGASSGGTGLGLWICKQLCQKMGGDITLYSKANKGTTFVLYVPVNNDRVSGPVVPRNGPLRDKVNVMIADDYSYNRDLHRLLLEREGAQASVVCNGKEAFEKYQASPPEYFDFIIMDVQMPEVDGFTAAKMIREYEAANDRKKVDIYFVSGEYYNEEEVMAEFVSKGGVRDRAGIWCLRKPIDIEIIRKVIEKYTNKPSSPGDASPPLRRNPIDAFLGRKRASETMLIS